MGGHPDGEIASAVAVDAVQHFAEPARTGPADAAGPASDPCAFVAAVKHATHASARSCPILPGRRSMGRRSPVCASSASAAPTSATVAFTVCGTERWSRHAITRLNEYCHGASREADEDADHPSLSRALGTRESIEVDVRIEDARSGDVVLCTDGLPTS
jgi:hypothetical protein